jgi:hypothetical protein
VTDPAVPGSVGVSMRAADHLSSLRVGASIAACSGTSPAQTCGFARTDHRVGSGPSAVVVADLDRDGDLDLAVANNTSGTVSVLLGNGDGTFGGRVDYATGTFPYAVAVADLNGDGFLDLAVGNGGGGVSVLLGKGDGTFQARVDSPSPTSQCPDADGVAIGDLDGDGKLDLVVANDLPSGPATISLMRGNGTATFGAPSTWPTGNATESVALGDFDRDGRLDVAAANLGSSTVTVLLGDGAGGFRSSTTHAAGGGPYFVATADLDGDGKLDLATANYGGGSVSVLPGNVNGTFGGRSDFPVGVNPFSVAAGDLDGDGRPDLAVANWTSGTVSVLLRSCAR